MKKLYTEKDYIARVITNCPEKLNAMASSVNDEMDQAIAEASEDDAVKAIIFKGAVRTLSAGADSMEVKFISQ